MTPHQAQFDHIRQITRIWKDAEDAGVEYSMRGGVCWPKLVERSGGHEYEGFILVAGQDVRTKVVTVFNARKFQTVENIIEDDKIAFRGIADWLTKMWSKYFVRTYYWDQDFELSKTKRLEVLRSPMVNPKPQFVEVDISTTEEARMAMWRFVKLGKLNAGKKGTDLHEQIVSSKIIDRDSQPAVHALSCLLAGIERYPWRER